MTAAELEARFHATVDALRVKHRALREGADDVRCYWLAREFHDAWMVADAERTAGYRAIAADIIAVRKSNNGRPRRVGHLGSPARPITADAS